MANIEISTIPQATTLIVAFVLIGPVTTQYGLLKAGEIKRRDKE